MTSPSSPENPDADLAKTARDLTDSVQATNAKLDNVIKWRRRFVLATVTGSLVFAGAIAGVVILLGSLHGTQGRLESVVDCNNDRSRQFVNAVAVRSQISAEQNTALEKLLAQVLHVTSAPAFTADINAYIGAANRLAQHPVPAYPANACK